MILYPAIDLKQGACVRLQQGRMNEATIFNDNPARQAKTFAAQGFSYLHVVDLDGACSGRSVNAEAISAILGATGLKIQLGGGIRNMQDIAKWIDAGVWRIILGTAAAENPELVKTAAATWPERIIVGIDVRAGSVAVRGWADNCSVKAEQLAQNMQKAGAAALIVTDIDKDGMKVGVNVELTRKIAQTVQIPVIASGGVRSVQDIEALHNIAAGVILGRALYDGDIKPAKALKIAGKASSE